VHVDRGRLPHPGLASVSEGRDEVWLDECIAQATFQGLSGEAPGEWIVESGVTLAEGHGAIGQLVEGGAVIGSEHLSLENREVNLDLVEPTCMHRCVHHDNAGVMLAEFGGGTLAAMG